MNTRYAERSGGGLKEGRAGPLWLGGPRDPPSSETTEQNSATLTTAMNDVDDGSPWDANPDPSYARQSEWSKITSDFTNVRHRSQQPS